MVVESIKRKCILKVGSNVRYFPNVARAIELIRKGYVGKPILFRGWIGNEGLHLLTKNWYTQKDMVGGGTLLDNGVHLIDLIRYILSEIVICSVAKCYNLKWKFKDIEDNALVIYELSNGCIASLHSSWTEKSGYMYFEIHGEEGYIHVDSRWSKATLTYGKSGGEPMYEDFTRCPKMSYDAELEDFVKDYRRGFHPKPTSYDGYRAVKIVFESYRSALLNIPANCFDGIDEELYDHFVKAFNVDEPYIRVCKHGR